MKKNTQTNFYKQSGKFSVVGVILIMVSTFIIGSALFAVYQLFDNWCSLIYFVMLAAIGVSILLGLMVGKIIKIFKIRNTLIAVLFCLIGFLGATYFKWAFYDYLDLKKYYYSEMEKITADAFYDFDTYFADNDSIDNSYELLHSLTVADAKSAGELKNADPKYDNKTLWEFADYDKLLGNTKSEVKTSLSKAKTMNAFDFTYNYRNAYEYRGLMQIVSSPSDLWKDIKQINSEGRWSFRSSHSHYSSTTNPQLVSGGILWFVWGAEFLLLGFMLISNVIKQSSEPFIESENDWALHSTGIRHFAFPNYSNKNVKTMIESDPYSLLNYSVLQTELLPSSYISTEIWKSRAEDEFYVSFVKTTVNKKKQTKKTYLLTYLATDKDFVTQLETPFLPTQNIEQPNV